MKTPKKVDKINKIFLDRNFTFFSLPFSIDPEKVGCFMRMQLRLVEIRNEVEMLVNPMFRRTYEDLHFKAESKNNNTKYDETANVFIVTKEDTINKQMEYLDAAKKLLGSDEIVKFSPSLKVLMK